MSSPDNPKLTRLGIKVINKMIAEGKLEVFLNKEGKVSVRLVKPKPNTIVSQKVD